MNVRVDEDERAAIAGAMRASLSSADTTQADFARLIGTSATRLSTYLSGTTIPSAAMYLRALRMGTALEGLRRRGLMTPDAAAHEVNRALAGADQDFALRMILQARDDLRLAVSESPDLRRAWDRRTTRITDDRFDTLFRVIIGHELKGQEPAWTREARLDVDWVFPDPFRDEVAIRAQTPAWLHSARIYIAERGLATA